MCVDDTLYLTFDVDWAPDAVVLECIGVLQEMGVTGTFFVTHATPALEALAEAGFELGLHPHFECLQGGGGEISPARTLGRLQSLVPGAVSVRSHRLTRSSSLSRLFLETGLTREANLLVPASSGIVLTPYEHPEGLLQLPHNWGDHDFLSSSTYPSSDEYLQRPGLKILNFHPIHLYLNTPTLEYYERVRGVGDPAILKEARNTSRPGVTDFLAELILGAERRGMATSQLCEIGVEERCA